MNAKTLTLAPALLLSLVTLSAVGYSKSGASPTEPAFVADNATVSSSSLVTGESRAQETAAPQQVAGSALTSNRGSKGAAPAKPARSSPKPSRPSSKPRLNLQRYGPHALEGLAQMERRALLTCG